MRRARLAFFLARFSDFVRFLGLLALLVGIGVGGIVGVGAVGRGVGETVGLGVGGFVGDAVGLGVGRFVGDAVGLGVGGTGPQTE